MQQDIIWTNNGKFTDIYASLCLNELTMNILTQNFMAPDYVSLITSVIKSLRDWLVYPVDA